MKLCKDCAFFVKPSTEYDQPECALTEHRDPVMGGIQRRTCVMERAAGDCGADGERFQAAKVIA